MARQQSLRGGRLQSEAASGPEEAKFPSKGTIDIWWLADEGGLAVLVPYLMSQHDQFKRYSMRVMTTGVRRQATQTANEIAAEQVKLGNLLRKFRIPAEPVTVGLKISVRALCCGDVYVCMTCLYRTHPPRQRHSSTAFTRTSCQSSPVRQLRSVKRQRKIWTENRRSWRTCSWKTSGTPTPKWTTPLEPLCS